MTYTKAEAKVVMFDNSDVITTSSGCDAISSMHETCNNSVSQTSDCLKGQSKNGKEGTSAASAASEW